MVKKKSSDLGEFEGKPVASIKIIITKTGDGLSKAMNVEPKVLHQGATGYIVLSYVANKIRFDPVPGEDEIIEVDRVQILEATGATFVDRDLIGDVVEVMRERIAAHEEKQARLREEAKGIKRFAFGEGGEDPGSE